MIHGPELSEIALRGLHVHPHVGETGTLELLDEDTGRRSRWLPRRRWRSTARPRYLASVTSAVDPCSHPPHAHQVDLEPFGDRRLFPSDLPSFQGVLWVSVREWGVVE